MIKYTYRQVCNFVDYSQEGGVQMTSPWSSQVIHKLFLFGEQRWVRRQWGKRKNGKNHRVHLHSRFGSDPRPVTFSMAPQRRYLKRGPEHLSSWWGVKVVIYKVGCANEHSDQQRNFLPSMLGAEMLAILLGCNCWYIQMPRWKNLRRLGPRLATIGPALGPGDVHYVFFQVQKIRWD